MLRPKGNAYLFYSNRVKSGLVVFMVDFRVSFINNGDQPREYIFSIGSAGIFGTNKGK